MFQSLYRWQEARKSAYAEKGSRAEVMKADARLLKSTFMKDHEDFLCHITSQEKKTSAKFMAARTTQLLEKIVIQNHDVIDLLRFQVRHSAARQWLGLSCDDVLTYIHLGRFTSAGRDGCGGI
jgi:hypothetical protein